VKGYFATGKLTKAMVEVLSQLPPEVPVSKEVVVQHLRLLGQMTKTRDIDSAWNSAKRQVAREHPDRFRLDGKILRRATAMEHRPREKISPAGQRRLAALATKEGNDAGRASWAPDLLEAQRAEMTTRPPRLGARPPAASLRAGPA